MGMGDFLHPSTPKSLLEVLRITRTLVALSQCSHTKWQVGLIFFIHCLENHIFAFSQEIQNFKRDKSLSYSDGS